MLTCEPLKWPTEASKAAVCTRYGPPEVLRVEQLATPIPRKNEVRIRILATAVTSSDCYTRGLDLSPAYRLMARLALGWTAPRQPVLGMVLSGVVDSVGPDARSCEVGDTVFDEVVSIWPASYLANALGNTDVDLTTNQLVRAIMSIQASDPKFEAWVIKIFGRLLGETISHEVYHTLLPVAFDHNVDGGGNPVDTGDLMDAEREFQRHPNRG